MGFLELNADYINDLDKSSYYLSRDPHPQLLSIPSSHTDSTKHCGRCFSSSNNVSLCLTQGLFAYPRLALNLSSSFIHLLSVPVRDRYHQSDSKIQNENKFWFLCKQDKDLLQ